MNTPLRNILFPLLAALLLSGCGNTPPTLTRLAPDAVILAFGDSLTHGTGAEAEASYPAVLAKLTGRTVINRGVPGELSTAGLARLPGVLDETHPDLLILCHGGNDLLRKKDLRETAENLRRMVRLAREQGVEVMLIGVPAPGLLLGTAPLYETVAEELDLPIESRALADILGKRTLKSDTVHPNAAGYRALAEAVRHTLEGAGAL
ncbi:arylesterase [Endothiovibrio diazotrophicus]